MPVGVEDSGEPPPLLSPRSSLAVAVGGGGQAGPARSAGRAMAMAMAAELFGRNGIQGIYTKGEYKNKICEHKNKICEPPRTCKLKGP
jgi:hypothetical protein